MKCPKRLTHVVTRRVKPARWPGVGDDHAWMVERLRDEAPAVRVDLDLGLKDHVLPGAMNTLLADRECNNSKSAHLASESHVAKWLLWFSKRPEYDGIRRFAAEKSCPLAGAATIAVSFHLSGLHPRDAKVWEARRQVRFLRARSVAPPSIHGRT